MWAVVGTTILGCYLLKLAGYVVPARVLGRPRSRRLVELVPVSLLAALVVVQALAEGRYLELDGPRLAGLAVAALAVWRRAPFIVVVAAAGLTAALLRLA